MVRAKRSPKLNFQFCDNQRDINLNNYISNQSHNPYTYKSLRRDFNKTKTKHFSTSSLHPVCGLSEWNYNQLCVWFLYPLHIKARRNSLAKLNHMELILVFKQKLIISYSSQHIIKGSALFSDQHIPVGSPWTYFCFWLTQPIRVLYLYYP